MRWSVGDEPPGECGAEFAAGVQAMQRIMLEEFGGVPKRLRFREWCDDAGLHGLSAHGLRKAAGTLLAEFGCTEHEIMSVLGHSSPKEGATYTRSANRRKLSESAFARLGGFKL